MMEVLMLIPHEISFGWVYFPPLAVVILFGIIAAWIISAVMNRTGLSRYFWRPPIAFLGFALILSGLFGLFILSP
jgi:uncharacterized protein DUF1656